MYVVTHVIVCSLQVHCCGQQESLNVSVECLLPQLLYLLLQFACSSLAVPDFNLAELL